MAVAIPSKAQMEVRQLAVMWDANLSQSDSGYASWYIPSMTAVDVKRAECYEVNESSATFDKYLAPPNGVLQKTTYWQRQLRETMRVSEVFYSLRWLPTLSNARSRDLMST